MEPKFVTMLLLLFLSFLLYIYFLSRDKKYSGSRRIPSGPSGLLLIGQNIGFLKALKADKVEEWFQKRIAKYGPVWKTNIFGCKTIIIRGVNANKFVFTCDALTNTQPPSVSRLLGMKNIMELMGDDHKRVRAALVSFLKVDVLKQYVAKVDEEIQYHLQTYWHGKNEIQVQPLVKTLIFNIICSLLFGIERGPKREQLLPLFQDIIDCMVGIPLNLPFTRLNRRLKSRKKLLMLLRDLLTEKREALKQQKQKANLQNDLITSLLSIHDDDSSMMMSDEEIIDNVIIVMVAGYDTTTILITLLVKLLDNNESIYSNILQEQKEILKDKVSEEALTWKDLTKMKYTWKVASEMLRINPLNLTFRRYAKDIEYEGYIIPKGWQVITSQHMTHMDDSIFRNPTVFDPARFDKNTPPFSFVSFGAGPRMCPGMELAKMETLAMIHRLVTMFKWELLNKDESFKRIPLPEFDQGLLIQIKPI